MRQAEHGIWGGHAYILNEYSAREKNRKWQKDIEDWLAKPEIDIERGHGYPASKVKILATNKHECSQI